MFVLEWYVYPVIAATVFGSMTLAYWFETWRENRKGSDCTMAEPHPCLEYLGRTPYGFYEWCWLPHHHEGPHDEPYDGDSELLIPE